GARVRGAAAIAGSARPSGARRGEEQRDLVACALLGAARADRQRQLRGSERGPERPAAQLQQLRRQQVPARRPVPRSAERAERQGRGTEVIGSAREATREGFEMSMARTDSTLSAATRCLLASLVVSGVAFAQAGRDTVRLTDGSTATGKIKTDDLTGVTI